MRRRIALLLLLLSFREGWCAEDRNKAFTSEIKKLECVPSGPGAIWCWDEKIILDESTKQQPGFMYFTLADMTPRPFTVPGIDTLWSLGLWQGRQAAIGSAGKRCVLLLKQGGQWKPIGLPKGLTLAKAPVFVPTNDGLALLTKATFWLNRTLLVLRNGKWRLILPPPPSGNRSDYGCRQFLFDSTLFAGFFNGEWDTGLNAFDIDHPSSGWDDSLYEGPTGMAMDGHGKLLICANAVWGGDTLYRYDRSGFTTLMEDYGSPSQEMHVQDVLRGPDGKIYTDGYYGIYTWEGAHFKRVVGFDLSAIERKPKNPITGKVMASVTCGPGDLTMDVSGNFFVTTFDFGVLCFIKDGHGYHLKQVITPEDRREAVEYYKGNR